MNSNKRIWRALLAFGIGALFVSSSHAQLPVTDAAHMAVNQVNSALDYGIQTVTQSEVIQQTVGQVKQLANEAQQIQNQITQIQQLYTQLERIGDASQIAQLLGLDSTLNALDSMKRVQDFNSLTSALNGNTLLNYNGGGMYEPIGKTIKTTGGGSVNRDPNLYKSEEAVVKRVEQYKTVEQGGLQQKEQITQNLSDLGEQLKSATTDAEIQKINGAIAIQKAALDEVNANMQGAAAQLAAQNALNEAMKSAQNKARVEARLSEAVDAEKKTMEQMKPDFGPALKNWGGSK